MEQAQALAVVRSLANGVDPESGEVFPPDSAYQRPLVVRALYEAAAALERLERFQRRKAQLPQKTGEPWTEEEDRRLLAAFDSGRALQELAAAHERTMGAVRARLLKYGRINA
jgi:DNA-binding transcriptional regulator YbjK